MEHATFYSDLPGFTDYSELSDGRHFVRAPEDWSVIVTDIEGSTKAIEDSRYKIVNLIGALAARELKAQIAEAKKIEAEKVPGSAT